MSSVGKHQYRNGALCLPLHSLVNGCGTLQSITYKSTQDLSIKVRIKPKLLEKAPKTSKSVWPCLPLAHLLSFTTIVTFQLTALIFYSLIYSKFSHLLPFALVPLFSEITFAQHSYCYSCSNTVKECLSCMLDELDSKDESKQVKSRLRLLCSILWTATGRYSPDLE